MSVPLRSFFFFFNDTATTEIYTLSLHDALPIWRNRLSPSWRWCRSGWIMLKEPDTAARSEEHTSELQSRSDLVCRLLLEKKKKDTHVIKISIPPINHRRQNILWFCSKQQPSPRY